jgi:hypothetical protein
VTIADALATIRRVGTVDNHGGRLRLRFPENAASGLQPAIDTLRTSKAEALAILSSRDTANFAHTVTPDFMVPPYPMVRPLKPGYLSWAEWKAAALNRLFQDQGVTGKPGRITAATVRHGEQMRADQSDMKAGDSR